MRWETEQRKPIPESEEISYLKHVRKKEIENLKKEVDARFFSSLDQYGAALDAEDKEFLKKRLTQEEDEQKDKKHEFGSELGKCIIKRMIIIGRGQREKPLLQRELADIKANLLTGFKKRGEQFFKKHNLPLAEKNALIQQRGPLPNEVEKILSGFIGELVTINALSDLAESDAIHQQMLFFPNKKDEPAGVDIWLKTNHPDKERLFAIQVKTMDVPNPIIMFMRDEKDEETLCIQLGITGNFPVHLSTIADKNIRNIVEACRKLRNLKTIAYADDNRVVPMMIILPNLPATRNQMLRDKWYDESTGLPYQQGRNLSQKIQDIIEQEMQPPVQRTSLRPTELFHEEAHIQKIRESFDVMNEKELLLRAEHSYYFLQSVIHFLSELDDKHTATKIAKLNSEMNTLSNDIQAVRSAKNQGASSFDHIFKRITSIQDIAQRDFNKQLKNNFGSDAHWMESYELTWNVIDHMLEKNKKNKESLDYAFFSDPNLKDPMVKKQELMHEIGKQCLRHIIHKEPYILQDVIDQAIFSMIETLS
ncbi:hypothetical protein HYW94_03800 [Candidatus Uhrbacteria bacterium]|nr:hypothetical protein [Candidatus Uhrbacteria bacterium]